MSPLKVKDLKVGVVGGSVAGSITAAQLFRLGADVTVFERSRHLKDRGAGMGLALSLVETLKQRGLVDADMGRISVFTRRFVVRCDGESDYLGHKIWEPSFASVSTSWDVTGEITAPTTVNCRFLTCPPPQCLVLRSAA